jgi:hypothetical protein
MLIDLPKSKVSIIESRPLVKKYILMLLKLNFILHQLPSFRRGHWFAFGERSTVDLLLGYNDREKKQLANEGKKE